MTDRPINSARKDKMETFDVVDSMNVLMVARVRLKYWPWIQNSTTCSHGERRLAGRGAAFVRAAPKPTNVSEFARRDTDELA